MAGGSLTTRTSRERRGLRRLPFSDAPMGRQLALSEALLEECATSGTPALRWYIPAEPALVLGNGQEPRIANMAACHSAGARVYRRTSGGTAVLVNAELLSLDVILPAGHALWTSDIVNAYRWVGDWWEDALHSAGRGKGARNSQGGGPRDPAAGAG